MITAPFNFVPLSQKVFFPDWAEDVSHDVPFEDSQSGVIDITITAKSPIFIRDGKDKEEFCHILDRDGKKQYYIPGSSVKGMIRNVLEIMSFSKMSFVDDKTYSIRDLKYDKYMDNMKEDVHCGWLYFDRDGNQYKIEDCGTPYRISYDEIEKKFGNNFKSNFLIKESVLNNKKYDWLYKRLDKDKCPQDLKDEYSNIGKYEYDKQEEFAQKIRNLIVTGTFDDARSPYKNAFKKYGLINEDIQNIVYDFSKPYKDGPGREIVNFEEDGEIRGRLVLTGHPSSRFENKNYENFEKIKASGKIYDFVFKVVNNPTIYEVENKVFDNFKFAYFDGRKTQPKESHDWSYWKEKLQNAARVPIFFHKDNKGITSFGLSYLYKFPYSKSIFQTLIGQHTKSDIDLAETIFGYSKKINDNQVTLKGRVQFSHGVKKENTTIEKDTPRNVLLGTPKASYYPIYLVQKGDKYITLMDQGAVLSGWKRYPIHKNFQCKNENQSTQTTKITPLKEGATFKLKIRVHNLKKVELGALLSALAFHKNSECFHGLGMAKSLGYGKIKLIIDKLDGFNFEQEEYIKAFEASMNAEIFKDQIEWHESEQIKNLFSMASEQNNSEDSKLEYMNLKDFAKAKNKKDDDSYHYLKRYIELNGITTKTAKSLITNEDIKNYHKDMSFYVAQRKEKKEWSQIKNSESLERVQNFIEKYPKSNYLIQAKDLVKTINKNLENEFDKKTVDEWNRIVSNRKHLNKDRIQKFIDAYSNSSKIEEAKKELEALTASKTKVTNQSLDFSSADDVKSIERAIKPIQNPSDEDKDKLEETIKIIYPNLNSSKKKKFKRSKLMVEWLGQDRFNGLLNPEK